VPQGLTSKGAATRQRVIEGAATLLRRSGADVSLDEVRAETGTSKSQLFHYFPDGRKQLLVAVLQHEAEAVITDQQPHIDALTSWAAWHAWRDAVVAHYRRQGRQCPLRVLIAQLAPDDADAAAVTIGLLERWHALLAAGVAAMQQQGLMRTDFEATRAADALLSGLQAALDLGLDALDARRAA
jgi:AcrR family transcriptional regulator